MRDVETQFRNEVTEAVNGVRRAKGQRPLAQDKAFTLSKVLWERFKAKGWEMTPPLRAPVGGLTGFRKR